MDRTKKQKISKPVWRPISTQSISHQGSSHVKVDDGGNSEVMVVQCSSSSAVSEMEDFSKNGEEISGVAELCISTVNENKEDANVDIVQFAKESGKHSVSVEVSIVKEKVRFAKGIRYKPAHEVKRGTRIRSPSTKPSSCDLDFEEAVQDKEWTKAMEEEIDVIEKNKTWELAIRSPSLDYSHFISLPLAIHPELVNKLMNFQSSILGSIDEKSPSESDGDLGIDKSIFIKPKTFHLTVLMLKLWNTERITAASDILQKVSSKVVDALEGKPISVRLKGLECMKGPLAKARVLYTPVEVIGGEGRLLRACQVITDAFIEAGLVLEKDARQKLKLHGTVMNARHRKSKQRTKKRFDSFDARSIVEKYGSEDWGEYIIPEVHLSQRFAFDEKGYYHCCAKISFPENEHDE
ncbi:hypothetical protein ACHQM5_002107 [Ranunculus cassubicifolius]